MTPPPLLGIHHLKLPTADLDRAVAFFTDALAGQRLPGLDHLRPDGSRYAVIVAIPGVDALVELRLDTDQACADRGFDPVTFLVADRAALQGWTGHLDRVGIAHSPVLASLQAWLVVLETPDGLRLRLMTRESHGDDVPPDGDDPWVQTTARPADHGQPR